MLDFIPVVGNLQHPAGLANYDKKKRKEKNRTAKKKKTSEIKLLYIIKKRTKQNNYTSLRTQEPEKTTVAAGTTRAVMNL